MKDFLKLEKKIGIKFKNKNLLIQSFVHRSYINEHPEFKLGHNERLEFLGDAVLELIITKYLFKKYPKNPEGDLTSWRASLVNSKMLSIIATELGLNEYLYLSRGEAKDTGKARQCILANTFEALIGAIYLDQGLKVVNQFLIKYLLSKLPYIIKHKLYLDAKTKFQEAAQDKVGITPTYQLIAESGPDHAKRFKIGVYLDKKLVATGEGSNKQEAQIEAAQKALKIKNW